MLPSEPATTPTAPDGRAYVSVVAVAWLGFFLVSFDYTAATVALPSLSRTFDVDTSPISWISLIYFLAIAGLLFPASALLSAFGYRRSLRIAFAVFAVSALGCSFTTSLFGLLSFRAIQGVSAAVLYVAGPMMIRTAVPEERRQRSFALLAGAGPAGISAGPAVGGIVTNLAGGQSVFLTNVPLALLGLWLLARTRILDRAAGGARRPMHWSGLGLQMIGTFALVLALNQGREWGWGSSAIVGLLVAAVVAIGAFAVLERSAEAPLIDPALFAIRPFRLGTAVFFFALIAFGGLVFLLPFFLQWYHGYGPHGTGLMMTAMAIATVATSLASGWRPAAASPRLAAAFGIASMIAGSALLLPGERGAADTWLRPAMVLIGAGNGLLTSTAMQQVMGSLPEELTAIGAAVQSQVRVIAQLLGVVLLETVFSESFAPLSMRTGVAPVHPGGLESMVEGFRDAFLCGMGSLALALPFAFRLLGNHEAALVEANP